MRRIKRKGLGLGLGLRYGYKGERALPEHQIYVGGQGVPLGIINAGEYMAKFNASHAPLSKIQTSNGGGIMSWVTDPVAAKDDLLGYWRAHGVGIRLNFALFNMGLEVDQAINAGQWWWPGPNPVAQFYDTDAWIDAYGQFLADAVVEGCPSVSVTPFHEMLGMHSDAVTLLGDGSHFRNAFDRIVSRISAFVDLDDVTWQVAGSPEVSEALIREYCPTTLTSFGTSVMKRSFASGLGTELYRDLWRIIGDIHGGRVLMCSPEWKLKTDNGVLDYPAASIYIDEWFEVFRRIPHSYVCWTNTDPFEGSWGYPELRWQLAHEQSLAAWVARWVKKV